MLQRYEWPSIGAEVVAYTLVEARSTMMTLAINGVLRFTFLQLQGEPVVTSVVDI